MAELSAALRDMLRQRAQAVKEKISGTGGGDWMPRWDLTGKNAIVEEGREVVMRLLPRWDFAQRWLPNRQVNPKYVEGPIFFEAKEHWFDRADGKKAREWCPTTFGDAEPCPIDEAWLEVRGSKSAEDKELARRIRPSDIYLFNAVLGPTTNRKLGEGGLVDIRYVGMPGTVFLGIINIMTGGEDASFARGDISDPREGFDIKLARPAAQGDRWKVDCMPKTSPLFTEGQKAAFAKWWERLIDLPAMVEKECKTYDDLYSSFHGGAVPTAPKSSARPSNKATAPPEADDSPFPAEEEPAGTAPEDPFGDVGDIDMPGEPAPPPAPSRPAARPAAPPATVPRRPGRR